MSKKSYESMMAAQKSKKTRAQAKNLKQSVTDIKRRQ